MIPTPHKNPKTQQKNIQISIHDNTPSENFNNLHHNKKMREHFTHEKNSYTVV